MEFRHNHFKGADEPRHAAPASKPAAATKAAAEVRLRIRKVSASPAEEYQLRPGEVAPISDAFAAMLLTFRGEVEITMKGIVVKRVELGGTRYYHHPDSPACNDPSYRKRMLWYYINRLKPDVAHLLDDQGRYLESLPLQAMPGAGDLEAQGKEIAGLRRQIGRTAAHLQRLHGEETAETLERLRETNTTMKRVVRTIAAQGAAVHEAAPSPTADRIEEATDLVRADRQTYERVEFAPNRLPPLRTRKPVDPPKAESAADILLRRSRTETECPY